MIDQSVALVTGASQGIGRATAVRLARDFSAVALAARNRDALTEAAAEVERAGAQPLVCNLDLVNRMRRTPLWGLFSIGSGGSMRC